LNLAKTQFAQENQKILDSLKLQLTETQSILEDERGKASALTIQLLRDISQKEKEERYQRLAKDNVRIGCVTTRREGHVIREIWEDGEVFRSLQQKDQTLQQEKEEMEAEKKILSKLKSSLCETSICSLLFLNANL
jgi:hypothetical protein